MGAVFWRRAAIYAALVPVWGFFIFVHFLSLMSYFFFISPPAAPLLHGVLNEGKGKAWPTIA